MTMMYFMMMLMMSLAWFTTSLNNPMTLSLIILSTAVSLSMIFSLLLSSWYAMILFLIYIGGMMVMFSYFVSFSSNDSMWMKMKLQLIILPLIIMKSYKLKIVMPMTMNTQILKLYSSSNTVTMILITLILLFMMLIIIKMVKINNGPLRGYTMTP